MTLEEVFQLIENLDYEEGLKRRLAPAYSLLQIDRQGNVVSVERFKELSTEEQQLATLNKHPGTIQLNGSPGMYSSVDDLREHIKRNMDIFSVMKARDNG